MKNLQDDNFWNDWIGDELVYRLMDYKSFYLTIKRLDLETEDPNDKDKYRLFIADAAQKKKFNSVLEAKKYAKEFIDKRFKEETRYVNAKLS